MKKPYLNILSRPNIRKSVLVAGLPGAGNVGVLTANLLGESLNAELIAELYSPVLPDYTVVNADGLCSLLKYSFFASNTEIGLLILVGDAQPPIEDIPAYYEICSDILDFTSEFGCEFIITLDGFPSMYAQKGVYIAGTSKNIVSEYASMGAEVYTGGRILGVPGLLLGLAKIRGIKGICLLSPALDLVADQEAAFNLYRFLRKILRLGIEKTI
ncbi:MAG: PAC2 family protein [Candidatus Bathyarchaeia archaeon]